MSRTTYWSERNSTNRQVKKLDNDGQATVTGNNHSMLVLKILKKIKETGQKFSKGNGTAS